MGLNCLINFVNYYKEEELEGGDYWNFANLTENELIDIANRDRINEDIVSFFNIGQIISQIENPILKEKMKENVKKLFLLTENLEYLHNKYNIFSEDELKVIIDRKLDNILKGCKKRVNILKKINNTKIIEDKEWVLKTYDKVFRAIGSKENDIKSESVIYLSFIEDSKIRNEIIKKYKTELPQEYVKSIEVEQNEEYIISKAPNYNESELDLGIDPRIKIGAEIEANNKYKIKLNTRNQKSFMDYDSGIDATVPGGIEVSTPPFSNNVEDVSRFRAVLDTMKEVGYYYDEEQENCSGQINIGMDFFNCPLAATIFVETFCNAEELLFHIANKEGQLIRQSIQNSRFKPVSGRIGTVVVSEDMSWNDFYTMLTPLDYEYKGDKQIKGLKYKKDAICLRNERPEETRFEIRIFNGSVEFETWKENILLIGKMAEMSNRCADVLNLKEEATYQDEKMLALREELREPDVLLEEKLNIFMDLIFKDDEKSKQIYIKRFYELEKLIEKTNTKKYSPDIITEKDIKFGIVDFQAVYESQIEKTNKIISYDPKTSNYEVSDGEER